MQCRRVEMKMMIGRENCGKYFSGQCFGRLMRLMAINERNGWSIYQTLSDETIEL